MKIIDFHTHIFPDALAPRAIETLISHSPGSKNFTDGTFDGLLKSIKKNTIAKAVILPVATKPSQVPVINSDYSNINNEHIIPFGALHPLSANFTEEIANLKISGIKGIKFHPEYQDFYIDSKNYFPIYEALASENIIVSFHAGKDPGPFTCDHSLPKALKNVHEAIPKLKIVAAHMGGWKCWDAVEQELCGLPIYFDTSAIMDLIPKEQFVRMINKHDSNRILFGSDSPWFDQGDAVSWVSNTKLSDEIKEKIFYKNAATLLNFQNY
jgi:predicted TIM-barrel fold metal-dependent hydrolase